MPMMHAAWSVGVAVGAGIGAACAALGVSPAAQIIAEAVLIAATASRWRPGSGGSHARPVSRGDRGAKVRQWLRGWLDCGCCSSASSCSVSNSARVRRVTGSRWPCGTGTDRPPLSSPCSPPRSPPARRSPDLRRPIVDRLGRVRTIRVTTALGVVGVVLFILAGNRWVVLLGVVLWAVGVSMGLPLGMSAAAESGPDPAARSASSPPSATSPTWPDHLSSACSPSPLACSTPCGSSSPCSSQPSPPPAHSARGHVTYGEGAAGGYRGGRDR